MSERERDEVSVKRERTSERGDERGRAMRSVRVRDVFPFPFFLFQPVMR